LPLSDPEFCARLQEAIITKLSEPSTPSPAQITF